MKLSHRRLVAASCLGVALLFGAVSVCGARDAGGGHGNGGGDGGNGHGQGNGHDGGNGNGHDGGNGNQGGDAGGNGDGNGGGHGNSGGNAAKGNGASTASSSAATSPGSPAGAATASSSPPGGVSTAASAGARTAVSAASPAQPSSTGGQSAPSVGAAAGPRAAAPLSAATTAAVAAAVSGVWPVSSVRIPPRFRERAFEQAIHIASQASPSANPVEGFYQGYGILAAANPACARQEAAYVTLSHRRAFFEGVDSGVYGGAVRSDNAVGVLNVAYASSRLVGTFGGGTFVGSFSRAGCLYDYALRKVVQPQELAGSAALSAMQPVQAQLGNVTTGNVMTTALALPPNSRSPAARHAEVLAAMAERQVRLGDRLLHAGKVAEARRYYERGALAGNPWAAIGLGTTYDPLFLSRTNSKGVQADALVARVWYRRAEMFGSEHAKSLLAALDGYQAGAGTQPLPVTQARADASIGVAR